MKKTENILQFHFQLGKCLCLFNISMYNKIFYLSFTISGAELSDLKQRYLSILEHFIRRLAKNGACRGKYL